MCWQIWLPADRAENQAWRAFLADREVLSELLSFSACFRCLEMEYFLECAAPMWFKPATQARRSAPAWLLPGGTLSGVTELDQFENWRGKGFQSVRCSMPSSCRCAPGWP